MVTKYKEQLWTHILMCLCEISFRWNSRNGSAGFLILIDIAKLSPINVKMSVLSPVYEVFLTSNSNFGNTRFFTRQIMQGKQCCLTILFCISLNPIGIKYFVMHFSFTHDSVLMNCLSISLSFINEFFIFFHFSFKTVT